MVFIFHWMAIAVALIGQISIVKRSLTYDQHWSAQIFDERSRVYCYLPQDTGVYDLSHPCLPRRLDHHAPGGPNWPLALCLVAGEALKSLPDSGFLQDEAAKCALV